jgi:hypothetical protein
MDPFEPLARCYVPLHAFDDASLTPGQPVLLHQLPGEGCGAAELAAYVCTAWPACEPGRPQISRPPRLDGTVSIPAGVDTCQWCHEALRAKEAGKTPTGHTVVDLSFALSLAGLSSLQPYQLTAVAGKAAYRLPPSKTGGLAGDDSLAGNAQSVDLLVIGSSPHPKGGGGGSSSVDDTGLVPTPLLQAITTTTTGSQGGDHGGGCGGGLDAASLLLSAHLQGIYVTDGCIIRLHLFTVTVSFSVAAVQVEHSAAAARGAAAKQQGGGKRAAAGSDCCPFCRVGAATRVSARPAPALLEKMKAAASEAATVQSLPKPRRQPTPMLRSSSSSSKLKAVLPLGTLSSSTSSGSGRDRAREMLIEMVRLPLEQGDLFRKMGLEAPRGILLHGPPGVRVFLMSMYIFHYI